MTDFMPVIQEGSDEQPEVRALYLEEAEKEWATVDALGEPTLIQEEH